MEYRGNYTVVVDSSAFQSISNIKKWKQLFKYFRALLNELRVNYIFSCLNMENHVLNRLLDLHYIKQWNTTGYRSWDFQMISWISQKLIEDKTGTLNAFYIN